MATSPLTLTFGFEIEAIFIFHEDILEDFLQRRHGRAILVMKDTAAHERSFRHAKYPLKAYRSWALGGLEDHIETRNPHLIDAASKIQYRAYLDEPINVVRELLSTIPGRENLATHHLQSSKQSSYGNWSISNDFSLSGVPKTTIMQYMSDRILCTAEEEDKWDSWGVELISPPYSQVTTAMADTSAIINKMIDPTSTKHGAFANESCGFHVHIGQPSNEPFPLATMQHLAWLLIIYEESISGLHAPNRRQIFSPNPDGSACEILSNRESWLLDSALGPIPRQVRDPVNGETTTKNFDQAYADLAEIKAAVFASPGGLEEYGLRKLVALMNPRGRGHVVNFKGLVTEGRPNTVEFRQHAGTLDVEEMGWWVEFCRGLVRVAHQRAMAGEIPRWERWEDVVDFTVRNLFEEMEFQEEGRCFFEKKMSRYPPRPHTTVFSESWEEEEDEEEGEDEGEDEGEEEEEK